MFDTTVSDKASFVTNMRFFSWFGWINMDISKSDVLLLWPKGGECTLIADTASEDPVLEISLCKSDLFLYYWGRGRVHAKVILKGKCQIFWCVWVNLTESIALLFTQQL